LEGALCEFSSPQFRHDHIGHQQIDRTLMGFTAIQAFHSVAGFENFIPAFFQHNTRNRANRVFVFYQQNDFGALGIEARRSTRSIAGNVSSIAGKNNLRVVP
jgi:hypothetical protein